MHDALTITQLQKTYANGVQALKGIDLNVVSGDFFALLGANGAGKSTTIGLISTLVTKTSGRICIHGYDLDSEATQAKSCLGVVPQEVNLNVFERCRQTLIHQAGFYGVPSRVAKPRIDTLLTRLGLWEKRDHIIRELSGGMKRRLMIARALVHAPRVLLLDEPTAGVDVEIRRSMWDFLIETNHQGTTIILTTHYLEEAEQLCKHIAIIDQGKIVEHTSMSALLSNLSHQAFILTTEHPLHHLSPLDPFEAQRLDDHTLELRVDNRYALNDVFEALSQQGIRIHSLRNKTNRLEELFMDRIHHGR